jgi:tRNA-dihydrouridine synthase C
MEGVGDAPFRQAIARVGGMDEAVTEFISVPCNAHVKSLAKVYHSAELTPIPLAAQIMGSDPELMAAMAVELTKRGAPRIDINCGCPSNTVTGRGAGSSLLKAPNFLYEVAKTVVKAVSVPVTIKMRSGYEDTSLFQENVLAAEASGVSFITLHPRTKIEGYKPPARWELIAIAKELVKIPVVGNGDITKIQDALNILSDTKCDALMIGRGAIMNPFLFLQIRAHFAKKNHETSWEMVEKYLRHYFISLPEKMVEKTKINKLKQLIGFLCQSRLSWIEQRKPLLSVQSRDASSFLETIVSLLSRNFS